MSSLVLDAGALVAVDRDDREMIAALRSAREHGLDLVTTAIVVGQVWRSPVGHQARLARFLRAVDVRTVDLALGQEAGVLLGKSGTRDPIDATVVLVSRDGDRILTSDPGDIAALAQVAGRRVAVVPC